MIPRTRLHANRVLIQIQDNLIGLQRDMVLNATTHKQMAQAQSPALPVLRSFVVDCATQYDRRLRWLTTLLADSSRRTVLVDALSRYGLSMTDLTDIADALFTATSQLAASPKNTYAAIIAASDALLASVDVPDSLWPE